MYKGQSFYLHPNLTCFVNYGEVDGLYKYLKTFAKRHKIVFLPNIENDFHPNQQRDMIFNLVDLKDQQRIITTNSPIIVQGLEVGMLVDCRITDAIAYPHEAAPAPTFPYAGEPIEDILENIFGVAIPQRSKRQQLMYDAAIEYYKVLKEGGDIKAVKEKLDRLSAPFSKDVAFHAFLEMERLAAKY